MIQKRSHNEREFRSAPIREVRVATADDGTHAVSGFAIVYNSLSVDLGGFKEIVAPGALTRTLAESPDVLCLRDHEPTLLLGRTTAGTLTLADGQAGLHFTCTLPATTTGTDLAESLRRGDIDSCSFGFCTVNDTWVQDANGDIIRTLLDVDLFEVSIVSFPAYPATTAAMRSAIDALRATDPAQVAAAVERGLKLQRSLLSLRLQEMQAQ